MNARSWNYQKPALLKIRCFSMRLPWLPGIWIDQNWAKNIRNKANCSLSQTSHRQKCWLQPHTLQAGPVGENGVRFWEVLVNETDNAYQKVWRKNLLNLNQCFLGNAGSSSPKGLSTVWGTDLLWWRQKALTHHETVAYAKTPTCRFMNIHEDTWAFRPYKLEHKQPNTVPLGHTCTMLNLDEFSVVPGTDRVWRMQEYKLTASIVTVPSNILRFYHFGLSAPGISLSSRYCSKRISASLVFALSVSVAG